MSQAVLYVNEHGRASINANAIMESAIKLVFDTTDPDEIDSLTIASRIEDAHVSLLSITAKLLANSVTATIPAPTAVDSRPDVVVAFTPPAVPIAKVATPTITPAGADPVVLRHSAKILELPLERPAQSRKETVAPTAKAKRASSPVVVPQPIQEGLPLEVGPLEEIKAKAPPQRRRSDSKPAMPRLPRRLSRIEDALKEDFMICLEDGKKVTDLGKHLEVIGITPEQYLSKWKLPASYPMKAPSLIQKRGYEYEYDPIRKRMVRTS
jgi:hypothetical protein